MSFIKRLNKFLIINVEPFDLTRSFQEELLNKFPIPRDMYERSYYQFRIQFDLLSFPKKIINNLIGTFLLVLVIIIAFIKKKRKINSIRESNVAVFPYKNLNYNNAIPTELINEFTIHSINFNSGLSINFNDFQLILKFIRKYPLQPYFLSKCLYKILFYRYIIDKYNPKAIISSAEYSFTSSVATLFCERNNVEQINIMHGEKLFYIRDSFFQFSRFYIWDSFYKNLFIKLKAEPNQFIVGNFPSLKLEIDINTEKKYSFTYYLAAENTETLMKIRNSMLLLDDQAMLNIRFHPRYSSIDQINEIFEGFNIENSKEISLEESFKSTSNVISLYSSVLLQAYFSGLNIVVDDINNSNYEKLKQAEYIILNKKHELLSSLIKV
ncbi:hypothetical protein [Chryseobacterium tongliaoense]|uniref:hypothetical protein n=1 Tax=Chryseobacterium tongliaoense TaxID=3240933 RepID=UPI0035159B88